MMYGCKATFDPTLGGWAPLHNENMETTCEGIYIAGDITGVEEANTALEEGKLAGVSIAEKRGIISPEQAKKDRQEIWERLNGLRHGPHGQMRREAKERQIAKFKESEVL